MYIHYTTNKFKFWNIPISILLLHSELVNERALSTVFVNNLLHSIVHLKARQASEFNLRTNIPLMENICSS